MKEIILGFADAYAITGRHGPGLPGFSGVCAALRTIDAASTADIPSLTVVAWPRFADRVHVYTDVDTDFADSTF